MEKREYRNLKYAKKFKLKKSSEIFNGKEYSTVNVKLDDAIRTLDSISPVPVPKITEAGSLIYQLGLVEIIFKATQFGDNSYYPYVLSRVGNKK